MVDIKEINNNIEVDENVEVIDAQGHFVAPGLIDVHVHLREPGGEHKETIKTGTKVKTWRIHNRMSNA